MKNLKLFTLLFLISVSAVFAQGPDFAKKFSDAEYHLQYRNYSEALPIYVELATADANNSNVSYKAGFCYLMTAGDKSRAIPFLEKAVVNTSKNYEEMSASEKRAPEIAFYDLANAVKKYIALFGEETYLIKLSRVFIVDEVHNYRKSV